MCCWPGCPPGNVHERELRASGSGAACREDGSGIHGHDPREDARGRVSVAGAARSRPSASAASIMASAIRSLYEPVGLAASIFTQTSAHPSPAIRASRTTGVSPIADSPPGRSIPHLQHTTADNSLRPPPGPPRRSALLPRTESAGSRSERIVIPQCRLPPRLVADGGFGHPPRPPVPLPPQRRRPDLPPGSTGSPQGLR
jgi:hypothetical protein